MGGDWGGKIHCSLFSGMGGRERMGENGFCLIVLRMNIEVLLQTKWREEKKLELVFA